MTMTNNLRTETRAGALEENQSAVSWAAIAAGAVATAALTLLLLCFWRRHGIFDNLALVEFRDLQ